MLLKKTSWMICGLLGTASIGLANNDQNLMQAQKQQALVKMKIDEQIKQDQATQKAKVEYVGKIKKDQSDKSGMTDVFRVTVPRSFAQIRMNPDNPSGHEPWYTDVYLNQMQDDNEHYLGRLFSNAGIQTGLAEGLPASRAGKLSQPVYSANQFYFTADKVPNRIILLGQSSPSDLNDLTKQYDLQLQTPFVTAIPVDQDIIKKAEHQDDYCQENTCNLELYKSDFDQPDSLVNNGADPWGFTIEIDQNDDGQHQPLKTSNKAYQDLVFFDTTNSTEKTARTLITNLHKKDEDGSFPSPMMVLPSQAANITTSPYNNQPIYSRYSIGNGQDWKGYYLYTTQEDTAVKVTAELLVKGKRPTASQSVTTVDLKKASDITRKAKDKKPVSALYNQEPSYKFSSYSLTNNNQYDKDQVDDYEKAQIANPDTDYSNYLVFNDGVYLYDNTTMGICDNTSKKYGADNDKFFCQNHANYDWGWFSWHVNHHRILDKLYLSDWQYLHPSKSSDYNRLINDGTDFESIYQGKNYTNYGNRKLVFDINGLPYEWQSGDGHDDTKIVRDNSVKDHEVTDHDNEGFHYNGEVFQNHLPFDVMMFQRHRHGDFRINGPDFRSGFIIPPKGTEKIYVDTGSQRQYLDETKISSKNRKYDFLASINGVYLSLAELVFHPSFTRKVNMYTYFSTDDGYSQTISNTIDQHLMTAQTAKHAERHMDPKGIGDFYLYDTIFKLNNQGMPDRPILTVLNTYHKPMPFKLTDGASQAFQKIWPHEMLEKNEAHVYGMFKKGWPRNQETLHFSIFGRRIGEITFYDNQDPACIIHTHGLSCSIKKQANTYPTTYVLDLQSTPL